MCHSKRAENIAISVLVAGAFVACLTIAHIAGEYDQPQYAGHAQPDQELSVGGTDIKNRRPPADGSVCRHAKTEKEYELCQAWRAADGAAQAASTAFLQLVVSIGGLIGLIWTVIYTARAARAAADAATQMARQLEEMRDDKRPWIGIECATAYGDIIYDADGAHFFIRLTLKNAGRTPAVINANGSAVVFHPEGIADWHTTQSQQHERVLAYAKKEKFGNSYTVIPEVPLLCDLHFLLKQTELDKVREIGGVADGGAQYIPRLVGYICYIAPNEPNQIRSTPFIVNVFPKASPNADPPLRPIPIKLSEGNISMDRLAVQAFVAGRNKPD